MNLRDRECINLHILHRHKGYTEWLQVSHNDMNQIKEIHDRNQYHAPVNMVIDLYNPYKTSNFLNSWATVSFSKKNSVPQNQFHSTCPPLAIMLTQRVEVGREECSRQDRISALKANFPSFILKTYTVLVAIFPWAISTWKKLWSSIVLINLKWPIPCVF